MPQQKLILASTSSTRRQIMTNAGLSFDWLVPNVDENKIKKQLLHVTPIALALELAKQKALSIDFNNAIIIGADQTLECNNRLYDKPTSRSGAKSQLQSLRGKPHYLHSAVALAKDGEIISQISCSATMNMRNFSSDFLDEYVAKMNDDTLRALGAYQLEFYGAQLFEKIEGDYFTILGLPLLPLLDILRKLDILQS